MRLRVMRRRLEMALDPRVHVPIFPSSPIASRTELLFQKVDALKDNVEFVIKVAFIEIFKEEVFDLLADQSHGAPTFETGTKSRLPKVDRFGSASTSSARGIKRVPIQIFETQSGPKLFGLNEPAVKSKEQMATFLALGSMSRATASTDMNDNSSKREAIPAKMKFQVTHSLHLVDLAGSERADKDAQRLKEGKDINRGLLALGKTITSLADGTFVTYRDSRLTRVLQDSLGGNSKTVMIACVSPANSSIEETLNTLYYADRARMIKNKAMINRGLVEQEERNLIQGNSSGDHEAYDKTGSRKTYTMGTNYSREADAGGIIPQVAKFPWPTKQY